MSMNENKKKLRVNAGGFDKAICFTGGWFGIKCTFIGCLVSSWILFPVSAKRELYNMKQYFFVIVFFIIVSTSQIK